MAFHTDKKSKSKNFEKTFRKKPIPCIVLKTNATSSFRILIVWNPYGSKNDYGIPYVTWFFGVFFLK